MSRQAGEEWRALQNPFEAVQFHGAGRIYVSSSKPWSLLEPLHVEIYHDGHFLGVYMDEDDLKLNLPCLTPLGLHSGSLWPPTKRSEIPCSSMGHSLHRPRDFVLTCFSQDRHGSSGIAALLA